MAGSTMVGDPSSWSSALVKISPYTYSAVGIAIAICVSVLGSAWGDLYCRKQFDRCCNQGSTYHFLESFQNAERKVLVTPKKYLPWQCIVQEAMKVGPMPQCSTLKFKSSSLLSILTFFSPSIIAWF